MQSSDVEFGVPPHPPEDSSFDGIPSLIGTILDQGFFMCMCSSSMGHPVDLVVLGEHNADHSLSLKEEILPTGHPVLNRQQPTMMFRKIDVE